MHPRRTEINDEIKELLKTKRYASRAYWLFFGFMVYGVFNIEEKPLVSLIAIFAMLLMIGFEIYILNRINKLRQESLMYVDKEDTKVTRRKDHDSDIM